tara:strand:- start:188 stop:1366 length:1179 start_codon:yes stop_codon:yes gene_type:complete
MAQTNMQYLNEYAKAAISTLINDGIVKEDQHDAAISSVNRTFATLDDNIKKALNNNIGNTTNKPKKRKTNKPRKMTGYRLFIKNNKADIKTQCNVDGVKVKFMAKAGELWKNMSADEKSSYVQLANEYDSETQQAKTVETPPAVVPVISDFKELAGPYEETYVAGSASKKSFKTLEEAYTSLLSSTNAVGITKSKSGRFKLRAGYKKNHDNTDKDGNTTPPFVYKSPKSETSWVLKSAISSYDSNNPFTKSNPFIRQETLSADVQETPVVEEPEQPVVEEEKQSKVEEPEQPVVEEVKQSKVEEPEQPVVEEATDETDESDSEEEDTHVKVISNGTSYVCFTEGQFKGLLFSYNEEGFDEEDYTGKKITSDTIIEGETYDTVVDGGPLEQYI